MKRLYYVDDSGSDGACGLFNEDFELIHVFDSYHGKSLDKGLMSALGFDDIVTVYHSDLVDDDEYNDDVLSNEVANLDLVIERLRERYTV